MIVLSRAPELVTVKRRRRRAAIARYVSRKRMVHLKIWGLLVFQKIGIHTLAGYIID